MVLSTVRAFWQRSVADPTARTPIPLGIVRRVAPRLYERLRKPSGLHSCELVPVPNNWRYTLRTWERMGLAADDIGYAIDATTTRKVDPDDRFRYFAGICWRLLKERDG